MGSLSSLAYWINTAKKLAAPVEGRITHNQWIRNPENAAKLGVTVEEAAKAHPDLVTIRQLGRNTDINPMAEGAMTDQQLRRITEMIQGMQDLNPSTAVRVGDSVGNLYKSPSMMEFLGAERVKDLPQGWKNGGVAHLGAGGNDFRTPKHAGMSHTFSSAGEPYVNKYGTEMVPEKGANGKYYLRESAGVEAPLLDPLDPFLIPKSAPLSIVKKLAQMAKAVPESIAHGAQEFVRAAAPAYVVPPSRKLSEMARSSLDGIDPVQLAALEAYIKNQAPFKPHIAKQRAALEYAVANGDLSADQAGNIVATRASLNDLLDSPLTLSGPLYRGMNMTPGEVRQMRVLGGEGPASFSSEELQAKLFTKPTDGKQRTLITAYPDSIQNTRGIALPNGFGSADHEKEVILHPSTRVVVERGPKIVSDDEVSDLHKFEGFFDNNVPYDVGSWADGGSVDRSPRTYTPTDGSPTTTGTRGLTRGLHDILQAMKEYHANA